VLFRSDDAENLDPAWLDGVNIVGVSAGASAPEELIQEVIERLGDFGDVVLKKLDGVEENITFKMPRELMDAERANASLD
jgi:4-hydroxy-3-methylbut-2-enyl diphosphate reductase